MECQKTGFARAACLFILGCFGLGLSSANASVITTGCADVDVSCTLQELSVGGANIEIDGVVFNNWSVLDQSNNLVNLADVDVVALDDQSSNVGLSFTAANALSTIGFDLLDLTINFDVAASGGAQQISGVSFELAEFSFGAANNAGFIDGFEDVYDSAGILIDDITVEADNVRPPVFDLVNSTTFGPVSLLSIEKLILLSGDADSDTVSLNRFEQRFEFARVSVPEPMTSILLISGLAGLTWTRRTRRHSADTLL